jgi:uncharacterized membrane protein
VKTKSTVRQIAERVSYSGPLPPSSELAQYERVLPGSAERILALAEKEVEHRHHADNKIIEKTLRASNTGQILSFALSIFSLGAVCLCVLLSQPGASIAPAIIAIPSILSVIFNRNK